MDKEVMEQITLSATNPENKLEQEVTRDSQENMKTEEGLTKDDDTNLELAKASFHFPCHYYLDSDNTSHIISTGYSL
jgi:hypothetical protein